MRIIFSQRRLQLFASLLVNISATYLLGVIALPKNFVDILLNIILGIIYFRLAIFFNEIKI